MSTDRALVVTARSLAATAAVMAVGSLVLALASGDLRFWWQSFAGLQAGIALAFAVFVWLIIPHQPRNAAVWAMAAPIGCALHALTLGLVPLLLDGDPFVVLDAGWVPADTPTIGWVQVVGKAASVPGLMLPLTLGVILFPDGTLPSKRWRPVALAAAVALAVMTVTHGWWHRPTNGSHDEPQTAALLVLMLVAVSSFVGFLARFRRSTGDRRLQYKWVVWGSGIGVAVFGGIAFVPDSAIHGDGVIFVALLGAVCWAVSYGIAVGRYRLYDVDVVISRTVVYTSLAVLIAGSYVAVVVGLGSTVGGSSIWLSMLATALVAVAFEPARARLQRWANRLVYGHRATPYEILGDLTRQLAVVESGDELLRRLAAELCTGTAANRVIVWLDHGGGLGPVAVAPTDASMPAALSAASQLPGQTVPIEHEGEVLGHVSIEGDPAKSLRPTDIRLARDLARSAALVVQKLRLDHDLMTAATEIDESRRRLIDAQNLELRRLEGELSGTTEQDLVAMKVQMKLTERLARDEGCNRAVALLAQLGASAQDAIDQIRAFAQGIYPPLLDADGLPAAIVALARQSPLEVRVEVAVDNRHPAELEGAVYFCVSEALTNASKHARGPVSIVVTDHARALAFTVIDSGPGFDLDQATPGAGLHNLHDRVDALGGTFRITSRPGGPTTVAGTVPLRHSRAAITLTPSRRSNAGSAAT